MITPKVKKNPKILLAFALLTLLIVPSRTAMAQTVQPPRFVDTQTNWAEDCISGMAEQGIMQGYPNGSFRPGGTMTRAEFAAMIIKAYPEPSVQSRSNLRLILPMSRQIFGPTG